MEKFLNNLDYSPATIVEAQGHTGGIYVLSLKCNFSMILVDITNQHVTIQITSAQSC
ncbi:hypothetical protein NC653_034500 [Populus alba x Populus x berolinensis]|uniref:Uncharacterized protein n=1 Tax=Populus alba x Populus x berolinensis TaxID=444605 RepID=A0AAD6LMY6_9ROSI|nr:hypothetical protein NC653_034500 [Populus alba x Populus x berolinensis]